MSKTREERKAELHDLWRNEQGKRYLRKRYLELTGLPAPGVVYVSPFIEEIVDLEFQTKSYSQTMDVILTWSGTTSHEIATYLREWLPEVIPGILPWVSSEDIAKGRRWSTELHAQLDKTKVSITCITPDNVKSPWVFYEVGYIAAKQTEGVVCPFLIGVDSSLVKDSPLGLFQWTEANKVDTWKLIKSINQELGNKHNEVLLRGNFDNKWPRLKGFLERISSTIRKVESVVNEVEAPIQDRLSDEAKKLLLDAANDPSGMILVVPNDRGTALLVSGRDYVEPYSARLEATWIDALNELTGFGLVRPEARGSYKVTKSGYAVADILKHR